MTILLDLSDEDYKFLCELQKEYNCSLSAIIHYLIFYLIFSK